MAAGSRYGRAGGAGPGVAGQQSRGALSVRTGPAGAAHLVCLLVLQQCLLVLQQRVLLRLVRRLLRRRLQAVLRLLGLRRGGARSSAQASARVCSQRSAARHTQQCIAQHSTRLLLQSHSVLQQLAQLLVLLLQARRHGLAGGALRGAAADRRWAGHDARRRSCSLAAQRSVQRSVRHSTARASWSLSALSAMISISCRRRARSAITPSSCSACAAASSCSPASNQAWASASGMYSWPRSCTAVASARRTHRSTQSPERAAGAAQRGGVREARSGVSCGWSGGVGGERGMAHVKQQTQAGRRLAPRRRRGRPRPAVGQRGRPLLQRPCLACTTPTLPRQRACLVGLVALSPWAAARLAACTSTCIVS